MSLCRCGGPLTSSILLRPEQSRRMRSGSLVSSWDLLRMLFYFLNGNPRRNNREHVLFLEAFKQIQGLTARALGSAAAWLPTARTTPPLPAGMTSLRKTRQRPRDMEILWGKRPLASCQRSEEVIGSYSSSFNNKAASLIAFGAELRPLPFCMFPEETFDIAALVASGNVPVD